MLGTDPESVQVHLPEPNRHTSDVRKLAEMLRRTNGMMMMATSAYNMQRLSPYVPAIALINRFGVFYDDRLLQHPMALVITLAHEVGHAVDFVLNRATKAMLDANWNVYGPDWRFWPDHVRELFYQAEERAWSYAEQMTDELRLDVKIPDVIIERELALAAYRKILGMNDQ